MSAKRCSTCSINYPASWSGVCPVCESEVPSLFLNINPDTDWKERVETVKRLAGEKRGDDPDEGVINWRLEELLRSGADYETANALARSRDDATGALVDLHRAIELVGRAGPDLAVAILT